MKKSVKIVIGLLGGFIVLLVVAALFLNSQSFFKYAVSPEIVSVELIDDNPVYLKEVKDIHKEEMEYFEEIGEELDDSYLNFDESGSVYEFKVTLSDGREFVIPSNSFIFTVDKAHQVHVSAYVQYSKCIEAEKQGAQTVPVYIEAELYKGTFDEPVDTFETTDEKEYTASRIESIKPLFDSPLAVSGTDYKLEEKEFEITYSDGTVKKLSPVREEAKTDRPYDFERYTFDGEPLLLNDSLTDNARYLEISYLDAKTKVQLVSLFGKGEGPFSDIKITDYTFDEENELDTVSMTLTKNDGETQKITAEYPGREVNNAIYADYIDGFPIYLRVSYSTDEIIIGVTASKVNDIIKVASPKKTKLLDLYDFEMYGADFFSIMHHLLGLGD